MMAHTLSQNGVSLLQEHSICNEVLTTADHVWPRQPRTSRSGFFTCWIIWDQSHGQLMIGWAWLASGWALFPNGCAYGHSWLHPCPVRWNPQGPHEFISIDWLVYMNCNSVKSLELLCVAFIFLVSTGAGMNIHYVVLQFSECNAVICNDHIYNVGLLLWGEQSTSSTRCWFSCSSFKTFERF
jgi:hypothetical protein